MNAAAVVDAGSAGARTAYRIERVVDDAAFDADTLRAWTAGRWSFVSETVRVSTTAPATAASLSPASTALHIDLQDGVYPTPAACAGGARKTVRYIDDGGVHVSDVALDATAASLGGAARQETGDRFLAWHCLVAPPSDGRWSTAHRGRRERLDDRRRQRRRPRLPFRAGQRGAINANIAAARLDADVDGALPVGISSSSEAATMPGGDRAAAALKKQDVSSE